MHYQSWLWLSVVQENILQRSKGKGHQRQYHFTRGGGLYAHKLGRKSEMFWLYANALLCMFEAKKRSVKTNIFCRLPSDPQIRRANVCCVLERAFCFSALPFPLSSSLSLLKTRNFWSEHGMLSQRTHAESNDSPPALNYFHFY